MNFFLILQNSLIVVLVLLLSIFLGIVVSDSFANFTYKHLTGGNRYYALQFLGIGMGGVLLALQALMSYKRAKAMEDTANAQAEAAKAQATATEEQAKANQNTERGQRQERLKNAIEHLGHDKDSVRLGGAYELFHLAQDTKDLRQTVLDILCAHIRQTTGEDEYRKKYKSKPSEEIQSLLTLLFVQEHEVFKGLHINLQGSWLNGVELRGARLGKAVMSQVHLQKAVLVEAHLHKAHLEGARLHGAKLRWAQLHEAFLNWAYLHEADLEGTDLHGAILVGARLHGAILDRARLYGAFLGSAHLQGADLCSAYLQGADFSETYLQGADLTSAQLQGARTRGGVESFLLTFAQRMERSIGKESDLRGVIFVGGLSQGDLDSLIEGLSDAKTKELRERLEPHVDRLPSHELPENSLAYTGAYTAEEAEQWIAEYEKAMSEVPEESAN